MKYRVDKYGNQVSALGFGCMRFPQKNGKIDMAETEREILAAVAGGVNYFDTAYIYPGSEAALGEILEKNGLRDRVKVATKLPHYLIKTAAGLDEMFAEELRRLRTDHVDYYLMHMMNDVATWERLKTLGIEAWLAQKKKEGAIGQVGFSYHGNAEMFCRVVDVYDWDFCQVQYNYLDEHSQAGRRGVTYAHEKGLPIVIMEPLRGGRLVNGLPEEARQVFAEHPAGWTPAEWAFRWLWNQPEITCVLSGMNSMEMVEANIRTADEASVGELGMAEMDVYARVVAAINAKMKVGCTGCGYCMPCPKQVDIPGTFAAYNRRYTDGKFRGFFDYLICTALRKDATAASNCVECGKCEKHCPQGIEIRKQLKQARKELEGPMYKVARKVITWLKLY